MKKMIFALPLLLISGACSHKNMVKSDELAGDTFTTTVPERGIPKRTNYSGRFVLSALAFKMSGDYSDNVAVRVNDSGELTYFPDPADISEKSRPVDLGDGWWLDRQGIGDGYRFTKYTFKEYAALKQVPSRQELLDAIIPGAVVTEVHPFPSIPASEAMDHLSEIKKELND